MPGGVSDALIAASESLRRAVAPLAFGPPVTHVYNPLDYAWEPHVDYLRRYGDRRGRVVFMGMNPGPFGMAQTGVPFGEISSVRDWMGVRGAIGRPAVEHAKRPVLGFDCARSEVSGRRLWGWAQSRYGTAEVFFASFFAINYCPLAFMEASGRNRIPEKLPRAEREPLFAACDEALRRMVQALEPSMFVGIGGFAEKRARRVLDGWDIPIGRILHPSPASPRANRGWAEAAENDLTALGIPLP